MGNSPRGKITVLASTRQHMRPHGKDACGTRSRETLQHVLSVQSAAHALSSTDLLSRVVTSGEERQTPVGGAALIRRMLMRYQ